MAEIYGPIRGGEPRHAAVLKIVRLGGAGMVACEHEQVERVRAELLEEAARQGLGVRVEEVFGGVRVSGRDAR